MRARYRVIDGEVVEIPLDAPIRPRGQIVVKDRLFDNGVRSTADGKHYWSRRSYNDHLKANGMVELGNDRIPRKDFTPHDYTADLHKTWSQLS